MILFIFEGNKREPQLFDSIQRLFFPKDNDTIVCSFGNNIYELYRQLEELGGDGDVVSLLREKYYGKDGNPFEHITASSDFSEIYLFFDYDFHNENYPLSELNRQLEEMLRLFDNETENGKLYINYPMVESIRYTKQLKTIGLTPSPATNARTSKGWQENFQHTTALISSVFQTVVSLRKQR